MDEDEDDVHRKGLQHWPSSQVQIKQTDTAGRAPVSPDSMLPCRVHVEPRRFLYGNAGLLLLASLSRSRPPHVVLRQNLRMMDPEESVETLIGQKLHYQDNLSHSVELDVLK
uniref:BCL2 modifying factor 1 n=1 Tax=Cyprinus carpio TaxID=7962 RepID=A0A8C1M381_CYPCA